VRKIVIINIRRKNIMDEKSTPIANLNNRSDDSEVVNEILNKYNHLQNTPSPSQQQTELEKLHPDILHKSINILENL